LGGKKKRIIGGFMEKILFILLCLFSLFLFACNSSNDSYEESYAKAVGANEKAYNNYLKNLKDTQKVIIGAGKEVEIYYGKYNGTYIVKTYQNMGMAYVTTVTLGDYKFTFPQTNDTLIAIRKNRYYTLEEAYEKGYISDEDVASLYEIWKYKK
jgi:hypothetical protein